MNHQERDSSFSPSTPRNTHISRAQVRCCERGVTLIEILITLLLVSIGLIGSLAMQARAMQDNQSAYYRSQAINMATDMADRIRLNSSAATTYDDVAPTSKFNDAGFVVNRGDAANVALAKNDIRAWLNWIQTSLPSGRARISDRFKICVYWDENKDDTDGKNINDAAQTCSVADAKGAEAYFGLEIEI